MQNTTILQIAVFSPIEYAFDYLMPTDIPENKCPPLGIRVKIPFGRKSKIGILVGITDQSTIPPGQLKRATAILDDKPIFSDHLFELSKRASEYYLHPLGDVLKNALPKLVREGEPAQSLNYIYFLCTNSIKPKLSPSQNKLSTLLEKHPEGLSLSDIIQAGFQKITIEILEKKNQIKKNILKNPNVLSFSTTNILALNKEQKKATDKINQCKTFNTFLIDGVTGSGKTEIYLQVITQTLKEKKQALVLVPEIGLTPQTVERFQKRFSFKINVFHSKLSDQEKLDAWRAAHSGEAGIVIGTRSALFSPLKNLGIIIIDEEHDASFKQQSGFRYSARDLAILRGKIENIPVVLGSATPSLESVYNASINKFYYLKLSQRANSASKPAFFTIDIKDQILTDGLSQPLLNAIKKHLAQHNQVLVFLNRRGFSPLLLCHHCGWTATCKNCDAKMTLHKTPPRLFCHHCGYSTLKPSVCGECGDDQLLTLGVGTERIEKALKQYFPQYPVTRIDRDTTRKKGEMEKIIKKIHEETNQILIGTQMLAKGHHFPNITLVAILEADNALYSAGFRATEQMGQVITQVAGRSGRAKKAGEVYIQTHHPENPLLKTLIEKNYHDFAKQLLIDRKATKLPPYHHLALMRAESKNQTLAFDFLRFVYNKLMQLNPQEFEIHPPIPALMEKKFNVYHSLLLISAQKRSVLHNLLKKINSMVDKQTKNVSWSLEVDPLETLA